MRAEPAATLSFLHFESKITFFVTISFSPLHVKSPIFSLCTVAISQLFSVYDSQSKNSPKKAWVWLLRSKFITYTVFIRFYGNRMANPPEICYGHTQSYYLSDNFWVLAPSTYGFDVMPFKPLSENGDLFLYYYRSCETASHLCWSSEVGVHVLLVKWNSCKFLLINWHRYTTYVDQVK